MSRKTRIAITALGAVLAFVLVLLLVVPSGCNDAGGVPSWERCVTLVGTPAFSVEDLGLDASANVIPPLLAAVLAGIGSWRLSGRASRDSSGEW